MIIILILIFPTTVIHYSIMHAWTKCDRHPHNGRGIKKALDSDGNKNVNVIDTVFSCLLSITMCTVFWIF